MGKDKKGKDIDLSKNRVYVILMLMLFFPYGLYMVNKHKHFHVGVRVLLRILLIVIILYVIIQVGKLEGTEESLREDLEWAMEQIELEDMERENREMQREEQQAFYRETLEGTDMSQYEGEYEDGLFEVKENIDNLVKELNRYLDRALEDVTDMYKEEYILELATITSEMEMEIAKYRELVRPSKYDLVDGYMEEANYLYLEVTEKVANTLEDSDLKELYRLMGNVEEATELMEEAANIMLFEL